jgi:hypothetical protein
MPERRIVKHGIGQVRAGSHLRKPVTGYGIHRSLSFRRRTKMTGLAKVLHHATGVNVDTDILQTIVIFCGTCLLLVLLAVMTHDLDLSSGFF